MITCGSSGRNFKNSLENRVRGPVGVADTHGEVVAGEVAARGVNWGDDCRGVRKKAYLSSGRQRDRVGQVGGDVS